MSSSEYTQKLRSKVLDHYGWMCSCCREIEPLFLCIDHKNNNGAAHRRELGSRSSSALYRYLIKNDFPDEFQTLCFNCNHGKKINGGECPHDTSRFDTLRTGIEDVRGLLPDPACVPV